MIQENVMEDHAEITTADQKMAENPSIIPSSNLVLPFQPHPSSSFVAFPASKEAASPSTGGDELPPAADFQGGSTAAAEREESSWDKVDIESLISTYMDFDMATALTTADGSGALPPHYNYQPDSAAAAAAGAPCNKTQESCDDETTCMQQIKPLVTASGNNRESSRESGSKRAAEDNDDDVFSLFVNKSVEAPPSMYPAAAGTGTAPYPAVLPTQPAYSSIIHTAYYNNTAISNEHGMGFEFQGVQSAATYNSTSPGDLRKTMNNERLAELALHDPKRARRIVLNRESATRSKERKIRYVAEMEQKVHVLQAQTAKLSAQITQIKQEADTLRNENNSLRFGVRAMEQQSFLLNELHESLIRELQFLRIVAHDHDHHDYAQYPPFSPVLHAPPIQPPPLQPNALGIDLSNNHASMDTQPAVIPKQQEE